MDYWAVCLLQTTNAKSGFNEKETKHALPLEELIRVQDSPGICFILTIWGFKKCWSC